jgi:4-hydroxy-3-polyprenylbenzoate decarboxylase
MDRLRSCWCCRTVARAWPKREPAGEAGATLLIDATMKSPMPPLALPTQELMGFRKALFDSEQVTQLLI